MSRLFKPFFTLILLIKFASISGQEIDTVANPSFIKHEDGSITDTLFFDRNFNIVNPYSNKAYYRIATFYPEEKTFTGQFIDYSYTGVLMAKGSYNSMGQLHGKYETWYNNGHPLILGLYASNELSGVWEYFNEDGIMYDRLNFDNNPFTIMDHYLDGKQKVIKGSGQWEIALGSGMNVKGEMLEGKRNGKWTLRSNGLVITEKYEDGQLKSAVVLQNGSKSKVSESQFDKSIFRPFFNDEIAKFAIRSDTYLDSYPYFAELTERQNTASYLDAYRQSVRDSTVVKKGDQFFSIVEQQPEYPGGMQAFYSVITKTLKYPKEARARRIQGRVFVQFMVNRSGDVSNIRAVKGIGGGCDEEAVRAVKEAGKWIPGEQHGHAVNVRMILPITFRIG